MINYYHKLHKHYKLSYININLKKQETPHSLTQLISLTCQYLCKV